MWKQVGLGLVLVVIAFLAVTTFAIWEDGGRYAANSKVYRRAPARLAQPSYIESARFQWKTAAALRRYATDSHAAILEEVRANP